MKTLFTLLALLAAPAFAENARLPDPCAGILCTAKMKEIAEGFKNGVGFQLTEMPFLASGECYHAAPNFSPDHQHWGYAFLDAKDGAAYMGGEFGFFQPENPYKSVTIEQARKAENLYQPNHKATLYDNYAYFDMNPGGEDMWLYFINHQGNRLYLIGQWGKYHRMFCELQQQ